LTTPARFSFLQLALLLVAAVLAVALFPSPKRAAPRWTVVVQDERGQGITGLPLSEVWTEGLLSPSRETALAPTDTKGSVTFQAQTSWSCLLGSVLQTIRTVLSFGLEAPLEASISMGSSSQELGLTVQPTDPQAPQAQTRVVRKNDGSFVEIPW
jgi:hypothetical protein